MSMPLEGSWEPGSPGTQLPSVELDSFDLDFALERIEQKVLMGEYDPDVLPDILLLMDRVVALDTQLIMREIYGEFAED